MRRHNRRDFIYGATSLAAMPLFPSSILQAQSVGTGKQDVIKGPWTHDDEPLGIAQDIPGVWNLSTDPDNPRDGTTWEIVNTDPLIAGEKHFRTTLVKNGSSHYRTERAEVGEPRGTLAVSAGDGHWKAPQKYWYGFLMRIDEAADFDSGYYCQWHTAFSAGGSPVLALKARPDGLRAYLEKNPDNGGNDKEQQILTLDESIGRTHAFIFEVFWDTRTNDEGSEGIVRIYIDDNPTPAFEWLNKNNNQLAGVGDPAKLPYFKYGLYRSNLKDNGVDGDTYIQNHTNYVVHGENADRQGVLDSLLWNLVDPDNDIVRPNPPTLLDTS